MYSFTSKDTFKTDFINVADQKDIKPFNIEPVKLSATSTIINIIHIFQLTIKINGLSHKSI